MDRQINDDTQEISTRYNREKSLLDKQYTVQFTGDSATLDKFLKTWLPEMAHSIGFNYKVQMDGEDIDVPTEPSISLTPSDLRNPQAFDTLNDLLDRYLDECRSINRKPTKIEFFNVFCRRQGYYLKYSSFRLNLMFKQAWIDKKAHEILGEL